MKKELLTTAVLLCSVGMMTAQRIDFSFSNAQEAQTHEPDYIEWKIPHNASSSKTLDNGMEITVAAAGNADILRDQWNKNTCNAGRDGATGLRLLGDGVVAFIDEDGETPNLTDTPTSIEIGIKGMTAGSHTAMAYHVWKDVKTGEMPKIQVEVKINDGEYVVKQASVLGNEPVLILRIAVQQDQLAVYSLRIRTGFPEIDNLAVDAPFRSRRAPDTRVERILVAVRDQTFLLGQTVIIQPDECASSTVPGRRHDAVEIRGLSVRRQRDPPGFALL